MNTRLQMPLPTVKMLCLLLFWFVIIVLFHCRAPSPAQYALDSLTSYASHTYHTLVCTLCLESILPRSENLLLLLSVPNALDEQNLAKPYPTPPLFLW